MHTNLRRPRHEFHSRSFRSAHSTTITSGRCAAAATRRWSIPATRRPCSNTCAREKLTLTAILNTHHHADHVGGNAELLRHFPVPVYGPYDERIATVSRRVREGDRFTLDGIGIELSVLEIPGHTRTPHRFLRRRHAVLRRHAVRLRLRPPVRRHAARRCTTRSPSCGTARPHARLLRPRIHAVQHPLRQSRRAGQSDARRMGARSDGAARAQREPTLPSTIAPRKGRQSVPALRRARRHRRAPASTPARRSPIRSACLARSATGKTISRL